MQKEDFRIEGEKNESSDDFGHGENSAILPIGVKATLDTGKCTLEYDWE